MYLVLPLEIMLIALQVLNIAVYRVLGEKGVYYGSKLGKKVHCCDSNCKQATVGSRSF